MRLSHKLESRNGFSIIEVLIVLGIMGVLFAGLSSMQMTQLREAKYLSEKLATYDLERLLINEMGEGSSCQYILNNPAVLTFDSIAVASAPQFITPTLPIYSKIVAGVPGPILVAVGTSLSNNPSSMIVNGIRLKIESGVGNIFRGNWEISIDPTTMVKAIKPISISTVLTADLTNPRTARIISCSSSRVSFINRTYHDFCATPLAGVILKPEQPNRFCTLTAVDDDVGNTVVAGDYKCRVNGNGINWIGIAPLGCGQVGCKAVCFDLQ